MTNSTTTVKIKTYTVGQYFATAAMLVDARTGRKVAETRDYSYGFTGAAFAGAEALAEKNGWRVVE